MSTITKSIAVKCKVQLGFGNDNYKEGYLDNNPKLDTLYDTINEQEERYPQPLIPQIIHGWTLTDLAAEITQNHTTMWFNKLTKGNHEVYLVNEDQYASVGERDEAVFSNKLNDLKLFCKDFDIPNEEILKNTTVTYSK